MWMVPTRSLVIGKEVEDDVDIAFPKPASDGIVIDETTGVLYLTDFEHSAIWIADPVVPGRAKTLIKNELLLRWPDGLSASRGYLWITPSALHELLEESPKLRAPYPILRMPLVRPVDDDQKSEL